MPFLVDVACLLRRLHTECIQYKFYTYRRIYNERRDNRLWKMFHITLGKMKIVIGFYTVREV